MNSLGMTDKLSVSTAAYMEESAIQLLNIAEISVSIRLG